jgi:hypothetical protein
MAYTKLMNGLSNDAGCENEKFVVPNDVARPLWTAWGNPQGLRTLGSCRYRLFIAGALMRLTRCCLERGRISRRDRDVA